MEMLIMAAKKGLYANIHAKRKRIAAGSGEKMRKPGSKGAPTKANFTRSAKTAKKKIQEIIKKDGYWDISKEIYLKHGSRKRNRQNINNKKIISKGKEIQYELKLDF